MKFHTVAAGALCLAALLEQTGPGQELGTAPHAEYEDFVPVDSLPRKLSLFVTSTSRSDVVRFYHTTYKASVGVAPEWTGNRAVCDPGGTSQAYADATMRRVNYYRAMAGLPADVALSNAWNIKAQQAALMMSVAGELSHFPESSWPCYSAGGAEAAGRSNLTIGTDGPAAIDVYMDDAGANNSGVGHRRWILYPPTRLMGLGNIPGAGGLAANDLWVIGGAGPRPTRPEWVAWPSSGYFPYQVMPRRSGRWSFSYSNASFADARVLMECGGTNVPVTLASPWPGYGDSTIVWIPQGVPAEKPQQDLTYTVIVSNLVVDGLTRAFTYKVTIIDPELPVLSTRVLPSGEKELVWPAAHVGYSLERTAVLEGPEWAPSNMPVESIGGENVVRISATERSGYFRLRKP